MPQINASLNKDLINEVRKIQYNDKVESFSQMIEILIQEAVKSRIRKSKKQSTKK